MGSGASEEGRQGGQAAVQTQEEIKEINGNVEFNYRQLNRGICVELNLRQRLVGEGRAAAPGTII